MGKNKKKDPQTKVEKRENHIKLVLNWLLAKGSITPMEALSFGCYRLGARIWDLRHEYGYDIVTERVKSGEEESYARYIYRGLL